MAEDEVRRPTPGLALAEDAGVPGRCARAARAEEAAVVEAGSRGAVTLFPTREPAEARRVDVEPADAVGDQVPTERALERFAREHDRLVRRLERRADAEEPPRELG